MQCRKKAAEYNGCKYDQLGLQPKQFEIGKKEECVRFFSQDEEAEMTPYIIKPVEGSHGRGIEIFKNIKDLMKKTKWNKTCVVIPNDVINEARLESNKLYLRKNYIVQQYIVDSLLLNGFKFDIRTWLLVASVNPLVLFYHEGFARVSLEKYGANYTSKMSHVTNAKGQEENKNHFKTFAQVDEILGANYMRTEFKKKAKKGDKKNQTNYFINCSIGHNYVALSQFHSKLNKVIYATGLYHLFACDWMIDRTKNAHLLECNGFPDEQNQANKYSKEMWHEMIALVLNLHLEPEKLLEKKETNKQQEKRKNETRNLLLDENKKSEKINSNLKSGVWKNGPKNGIKGEVKTNKERKKNLIVFHIRLLQYVMIIILEDGSKFE